MAVRECPFCGRKLSAVFRDCPYCHETLPELRVAGTASSARGKGSLRRGLLYMMVVAVIYYFLSSSSPVKISLPFAPILTTYVLPLLFLAALGLALYGIFFRS